MDKLETCNRLHAAKLCNHPNTTSLALAKCAQTCGLCDRPGAGGGCPDFDDECPSMISYMSCNDPYMQENCMKSCRLKTCLCKLQLHHNFRCVVIKSFSNFQFL